VTTPTEIKAQAIALHALGYSCRKIEKQLKAKFLKADIPNHATINRWVRIRPTAPVRRLRHAHTTMRWWEAASRAAEIVCGHLDDIEKWPFNKAIVAYGRMADMAIALERLDNES
jgi:hypothetical protein